MSTLAEVLAQHQLVFRGMSYGSPDRCSCGAETLPERGDEDVSVRRSRAFAEHQSAVVAEWLTGDGAVEVVADSLMIHTQFYDVAARHALADLAAHAKGEAS